MISDTTNSEISKIKESCNTIKPLVAIRCITYNHEPYIRDALEGFVMQKTNFPFVAIVHDDASRISEQAEYYLDIKFIGSIISLIAL